MGSLGPSSCLVTIAPKVLQDSGRQQAAAA
jgi:hypothetical protein